MGLVDPPSNTVQYILLGIMGGLILLLIVLSVSLMCTHKKYEMSRGQNDFIIISINDASLCVFDCKYLPQPAVTREN